MKDAIIIVKKHRKVHAGHHGGAWKVAYADFVTAMMAFFMVMWLINQNHAVKAAIAAYFRNPGAFDTTASASVLSTPAGIKDAADAARMGLSEEEARKALRQAAENIKEQLARTGGLKGLDKQVEIQVTDEGLRIELVDSEQSVFFDTGSAKVKPETERLLVLIAAELAKLSKPVIVEGHTDSRQYSSDLTYSNWDLSADRANAARRVIQNGGLPPRLISSVRGYADRRPRVPGDSLDPRNRRVSIVVPIANSKE